MKRLIWNKPDGSCCTFVFSKNFLDIAKSLGMTEEELREKTLADYVNARPDLAGLVPVEVDEDEIDDPLNFGREVWGHGAKIDMPKARVIKTGHIRGERNARLNAIDNSIRAAEDGNTPGEVARLRGVRQSLRDLPATIQPELEAIDTPEALEVWQPAWPDDA